MRSRISARSLPNSPPQLTVVGSVNLDLVARVRQLPRAGETVTAASLMAFPPTLGQLINTPFWRSVATFFSPNGAAYVVGESLLIVVFTYFYTAVTFNPVEQADNLKKYGGFIPGVRPGRPTAEYLDRILARLTFPGALYLAAIAALPTVLINQTSANFFFGGTSILIVVGVALDTMKQLEAQLMMRNYEGFLK